MNTDTPRTDKIAYDDYMINLASMGGDNKVYVPSDFARQLERELNEWKQCAEELAGKSDSLLQWFSEHQAEKIGADLEREELVEAISKFNQLKGKSIG